MSVWAGLSWIFIFYVTFFIYVVAYSIFSDLFKTYGQAQ